MNDYAQRLEKLKAQLEKYETKLDDVVDTGVSWRLRNGEDSRELTNVSPKFLEEKISKIKFEIKQLEALMKGQNPNGVSVRAKVL